MLDLSTRSLYLCVGLRPDITTFLPAVLRGGVDVVQLRDKDHSVERQRAQGEVMATICRSFNVPFIVNDSPWLARDLGADGVHVGQQDVSVATCREILGDDAVVGLSTHSPTELNDALDQPCTYLSAGPLVPTPTKPGRPGTGLAYAVAAQSRSLRPVFVTGGVDESNVADLIRAGLRHFVVVRALTEARDPEGSARQLRRAMDDALSDGGRATRAE